MMPMIGNDIIGIIAARSRAIENPGDYRKEGLLYCGNCRTNKERRITVGGVQRIVGCMCQCANERYEAQRMEDKASEERTRIRQLKAECIQDKKLVNCTFSVAEMNPNLEKCQKYVAHWDEVLESNLGLVFWGEPGGGKTFAAACIANALVERGIPVLMTSLPKIINAGWNKSEIVNQIHRYPLMILDDLGAERSSDFAAEIAYMVVDERNKSGKPMIVTTNLPIKQLSAQSVSITQRRIYERIPESCVPMYFKPGNFRRQSHDRKMEIAKKIFS